MNVELFIPDEAAMESLGRLMASHMPAGLTCYLQGELGSGKTTLVRGLLRGLGHTGAVKSPTFTLVEPYEFANYSLYHFDLYRLSDPDELEYLGLRDYFRDDSICLVEWPEKGGRILPRPDVLIQLTYLDHGRDLKFTARTDKGQGLLQAIKRF
jgi:tRNA threonylcarbamoyladenosine biosynthesis protein TsaE